MLLPSWANQSTRNAVIAIGAHAETVGASFAEVIASLCAVRDLLVAVLREMSRCLHEMPIRGSAAAACAWAALGHDRAARLALGPCDPGGVIRNVWRLVLLPSNPACALVQMSAQTLRNAPAYRRMSRAPLGGLAMSRIESVPQVVTALLDEVPPASLESTQLQLVRSGSLILQQSGRQRRFGVGELAVYDVSEPFEFVYPTEFSTIIVQMPTTALGGTGLPDGPTSASSGPRSVGRDMVASLLATTDAHFDSLSANSRVALSRAIVDAMRLAAREARGERQEYASSRAVLAQRARDYVERHASDITLSTGLVAAALHVSVRTLHAAFEDSSETLGQIIRSIRIDRARTLLVATALSVSEVANEVGYADATHFIRVFKGCEGVTPSVWRRRQLGSEGARG